MNINYQYGGGLGQVQQNIGAGFFRITPKDSSQAGCMLQNDLREVDTSINPAGGVWRLPAQDYTIELINNQPAEIQEEDVLAYFRGENSVLPPTEQEGVTRDITFTNSSIDEHVSYLFRVVPTIKRKSAAPLSREDCLEDAEIIILDENVELEIVLNLYEVYLTSADVSHNVTGSVVVVESVTGDGSAAGETFAQLKTLGSTVLEASVTLHMKAGPPELLEPHLKKVRVQYGQMRPALESDWLVTQRSEGKGRIKADVLIEGTVTLARGQTFAVPEFVPFLIVRDPPGDGSSASVVSSHSASLSMGLSKETSDGFTQVRV